METDPRRQDQLAASSECVASFARQVVATFTKEVRCLIRDPHTVLHSVLIPLFLYPSLVWAVIQVVQYSEGVQQRQSSRLRVLGVGDDELMREHFEQNHIELLPAPEVGERAERAAVLPGMTDGDGDEVEEEFALDAYAELRERTVDAWVVVRGASSRETRSSEDLNGDLDPAVGGLGRNSTQYYDFVVLYTSADDASAKARERIDEAISEFRSQRLEEESRSVGRGDRFYLPLHVSERDVATKKELSKRLASLLLPHLMLIMTALGALYPALDLTVGERERSCLETTLVAPVDRATVVVGKYLAVVLFSLLAFSLNFASMCFTFFHLAVSLRIGDFAISGTAVLMIALAPLLLRAFFGALMMVLALQARSFKEGQSYLMTVYLLAVVPAFVTVVPEASFGPVIAWIPVVNVAFLFRQALAGELTAYVGAVTLITSTIYTATIIALSTMCLRRMEVIAGPESFVRRRFWSRRRSESPRASV